MDKENKFNEQKHDSAYDEITKLAKGHRATSYPQAIKIKGQTEGERMASLTKQLFALKDVTNQAIFTENLTIKELCLLCNLLTETNSISTIKFTHGDIADVKKLNALGALSRTQVKTIFFTNVVFDYEKSTALGNLLRKCKNITHLVLNYMVTLEKDGLAKIIEGSNLKTLNINSLANKIDASFIEKLGEALKNSNIKTLLLGSNGINTSIMIHSLKEALKGTKVREIYLAPINFSSFWDDSMLANAFYSLKINHPTLSIKGLPEIIENQVISPIDEIAAFTLATKPLSSKKASPFIDHFLPGPEGKPKNILSDRHVLTHIAGYANSPMIAEILYDSIVKGPKSERLDPTELKADKKSSKDDSALVQKSLEKQDRHGSWAEKSKNRKQAVGRALDI